MSADDLLLAELLCARLCHDLAGPVGAAAAGAELLEDGIADAETVGLVAASAAGAAARLKFLRAAFGPATRPQPTAALRELIAAHLATSGSAALPATILDWRVDAAELPADAARLLLNLVLLACDALPRGGTVSVHAGGPAGLAVTAQGSPAALTEEAGAVLAGRAPPRGPRGAQAALARRLADRVGDGLSATQSEGIVELRAGSSPISHPDGQGSF